MGNPSLPVGRIGVRHSRHVPDERFSAHRDIPPVVSPVVCFTLSAILMEPPIQTTSMQVIQAQPGDVEPLRALAREVEPLFGPMADEPTFIEGLLRAINEGRTFCVRALDAGARSRLLGGIIVSTAINAVAWLAVASSARRNGAGSALLRLGLERLDMRKPIEVITFAESVAEGTAARRLYAKFGFVEAGQRGANPAGVPVVAMVRSPGSTSASAASA